MPTGRRPKDEEQRRNRHPLKHDWIDVPDSSFAASPDLTELRPDVGWQEAFAFRARYDHGYEQVELFAYLNRRVLIAELATEFTDSSGRAPYYVRTFYRCT